MESSIAEFLMRQLASEQLPTSPTCGHDAHRMVCVRRSGTLPTTSAALWSAAYTHSPAVSIKIANTCTALQPFR